LQRFILRTQATVREQVEKTTADSSPELSGEEPAVFLISFQALTVNKKQGTREQGSALVSFIAGRKDQFQAVTSPHPGKRFLRSGLCSLISDPWSLISAYVGVRSSM
jgi:hypothetical protein